MILLSWVIKYWGFSPKYLVKLKLKFARSDKSTKQNIPWGRNYWFTNNFL